MSIHKKYKIYPRNGGYIVKREITALGRVWTDYLTKNTGPYKFSNDIDDAKAFRWHHNAEKAVTKEIGHTL